MTQSASGGSSQADVWVVNPGGGVIKVGHRDLLILEEETWPNPVYWFDTKAKADAYSLQHYGKGAANQPGTQAEQNVANSVSSTTGSVINPLSGLVTIGDFFSRLGEPQMWVRIAKVVAGGALLIIGVAHITGADNQVFNAARNVPIIPV